ncbi:MAG: hypothetical protein FJ100_22005 [Deltaproteobacteria bacterium]|nr:hypothetical protein [Deltaproteobacteria bacterium]
MAPHPAIAARTQAAQAVRRCCVAAGVSMCGALVWIGGAAALAVLNACETQPLYVVCKLDEDVTKKGICQGGTTTKDKDTSSCVVRSHPQCDRSVCLSYFGLEPVCTTSCSRDDDPVCGATAFCWTFSEADAATKSTKQMYCVPDVKKQQAGQK